MNTKKPTLTLIEGDERIQVQVIIPEGTPKAVITSIKGNMASLCGDYYTGIVSPLANLMVSSINRQAIQMKIDLLNKE